MFNKSFSFVICFAVFTICMAPQPAHANWWEFFFPSLKEDEGPDPSETLQAPFADPDAVVLAPAENGVIKKETPIHIRHRPSADIADWVQQIVPDLMSYSASDYKGQYAVKSQLLDETAQQEYVKFLKNKNYLKTLKTGKYDIRAFVAEIPLLMNEGAVEGRYRWLYKAKVMVTYIEAGLTDYPDEDDVITQTMYVTVQVGRIEGLEGKTNEDGEVLNEHGVLIESFNAKVVKDNQG